jgi:hypothetical protein
VGHNAVEFVIDFGQFYDGNKEATFHTRIITSPAYANELLAVLKKSIGDYDRAFGTKRPMEGDD